MTYNMLLSIITFCKYSYLRRILLTKNQELVKLFKRCSSMLCESNDTVVLDKKRNRLLVLGIETSCDDTGAAVVDDHGTVLGDALISQTRTHVELGGIIPPIARDLHKQHIDSTVHLAIERAGVNYQDLNAIAVTVKPGFVLSLLVGLRHAKALANQYRFLIKNQKSITLTNTANSCHNINNITIPWTTLPGTDTADLMSQSCKLPLIPIHHMEAHALTARMITKIEFPFLVLLASGGHCLLAIAQGVSDFLLLGRGIDDSPGDAFDKTSRRLKLKNLPECSGLSGGAAVELLAQSGNPMAFQFPRVMTRLPDCNFSFSGIKFRASHLIEKEEERLKLSPTSVLPNASDICASFQYAVLHHLARRLQRAFLFCELERLLPASKTLVVSGGVASNKYLRTGLKDVCEQNKCQLVCPPPHLCTDNGIMIAWNGMEKLLQGIGQADDPDTVDVQQKCPLGQDISEKVVSAAIKLPKLKL